MNQPVSDRGAQFYAQTYDASVPDWPGEIEFYCEMALETKLSGGSILEVACGTGRVAIRLAREGVGVVGLDLSSSMLAVAQKKGADLQNIRWIQADMRSFELEERFALAIIPGHAFQNLNSPQDQAACLECITRHLIPGGRLVVHLDHQDITWLGDLMRDKGGRFEPEEQFLHPETGSLIRASRSWSYERSTQTAVTQILWEEIGADGQVVHSWQTDPVRLHCIFRFEMEHLLARTGLLVEGLYGDFFRQPLQEESTEMIWVARKEPSSAVRQTRGA